MRTGDTRRLGLNSDRSRLTDSYILGLGSIATQTVYIKLILSSQVGGELYAALAIGGWIAAVGTGAFLGGKIRSDLRAPIWLISAILKIPLAFLIFVYPSFFTGDLDPVRFLPLVFIGIAPSGVLYGLLFPLLISKMSKTSTVYRNEAVGSIVGGVLMLVFSYVAIGGFAALFFLSGIEISRTIPRKAVNMLIPVFSLMIGLFAGPQLDKAGLNIRWPGFKTVKTAHGFSGLWALHIRENQLTITHNGEHLQTIPDRQLSEEALLWPLLYHPGAGEMLLVGFEGIEVEDYLPKDIHPTKLISDKAFFRLGIREDVDYIVTDPLSYNPVSEYDVINLFLHGGGDLSDNRFETGYFFEKCGEWLKNDGVLYVSAVSDENYISPDLGKYLAAIKNTLENQFDSVTIIPGPRIGLICYNESRESNPVETFDKLRIDSPYFNESLASNRMARFRIARIRGQIPDIEITNNILKPSSVVYYLQWVGSMFGHSGYLFQIYIFPYPLLFFPLLILIPWLIKIIKKTEFISHFSITLLGALGMTSEIAALYLFQLLFGNLYLHVGLIIAVFMAGMAMGAHYSTKLRSDLVIGPMIGFLLILLFSPNLIESEIGLNFMFILLYLLAAAAGFCSGGGFAILTDMNSNDRRLGATLYGADLYGAMAAAILAPGIIVVFGVEFLFWSLIIIGLVIRATLWYLRG